jgi:heme-degrading monooxygenase HmoA
MVYSIIWEFQVPHEKIVDFETAYGSAGIWASLFARADGFIAVELLRCTENERRYVTIDRWTSRSAFEAFKAAFKSDYHSLDERLEGIASTETRIGAFLTPD